MFSYQEIKDTGFFLQGQTAFDVADTETIKLLEELKLKQASVSDS